MDFDSASSTANDSTSGARDDAFFMRRALAEAKKGWGQTAPNPLVGAVVVRDGEIIAVGHHERFGGAHAEINALREAGDRAGGATVYVTLEPCAHHGKTPPCANALIDARVARVVIATRDPNPEAAGGIDRLRAAGIEVRIGVEEPAARELNASFVNSFTSKRPWITVKLALSIDGALADASGRSQYITGEGARRIVHEMRAGSDAIAAGIGTVLTDDPQLTVRDSPSPRVAPVRVIFDRSARLPLDSSLARTAREISTIIVADAAPSARVAALEAVGVRIIRASTLPAALEALKGAGVRSLLVEGGARLTGALFGAESVDRLVIFQGSVILGAGALGAFAFVPPIEIARAPRWRALERREIGTDTMTVYAPPAVV